jgi:exosortase E/protease (VPEID-CTERM system)
MDNTVESTILDPRHVGAIPRRAESLLLARWLGLLALLALEVLFLGLLFDAQVFAHDPRWWAVPMRYAPRVPQVFLAVAGATLILGGPRLRSCLGRLSAGRASWHRAGVLLAGHLAAFAGFAAFTASVWDEPVHPTSFGGGKALAWVLAGSAAAVLWLASALPIAAWRRSLGKFPVALLGLGVAGGVVAWGMGQWTRSFWTPLSRSTLWVVEHLLRCAFRDVVSDPAGLGVGTPAFGVNIAPQCSGYEGIGLVWVFLAGAFWAFRRQFRFPRAWLLIPIGTALIWVCNAVRIAGLIAVGTLLSPAVALGGFHSMAGWLGFNLVGLGLIAGALRCPFFVARAAEPEAPSRPNPTAAYLMPLLVLVGAALVTGAFTAGFDRSYPIRMAAVIGALAWYRRDYAAEVRPAWSWSGAAIGIAVFLLWMALEPGPSGSADGFDPGRELGPGWAAAWLVARVLGSVLVVPLAEELAFRGYLIRRLIAADFRSIPPGRFTWASFALSSAAFGALHGHWLAGTLAGACYTLALYRRGRLGDAVLAHALTNALIAAYVLTTGTWSLWS